MLSENPAKNCSNVGIVEMSLFKMVLVLSLSLLLVVTEYCTTIQLQWFLLTSAG